MLFAANADGPHGNILGLVEEGVFPLVTVSNGGFPVGREKIGFVTAPNAKKYECSHHAVVLPIAECAFLDYVLDYGTEARREGVARHFFKQMVAGTWRLHQLGIAHLDLKLENMLLSAKSSDATLMVSDFGLSEKVGSTGWCDYQITACSASYAPPEVYFPNVFAANHDNTNAFAVDVWTLGVCLATMVTGVEIFNAEYLTKRKHVVFAEMRAAQRSGANGANGLREACSAFAYSAALSRFNRLGPSLQSLLDSMLRVDPEARPTLAQVAEHSWVNGIPEPTAAPPAVDAPQPRSLAAAPPAVDAPQHRSLAATAPAYKSLGAADEAEEPRYNACSAAPTAAPTAYRGLSALANDDEPWLPPIGRCNVSRLV